MSPPFLTRIIDQACGSLSGRPERRPLPRLMRVHPQVFASVTEIRAREIADGYPLIFLGMELVAEGSLPLEGFDFVE
jgi:hypothetical protein